MLGTSCHIHSYVRHRSLLKILKGDTIYLTVSFLPLPLNPSLWRQPGDDDCDNLSAGAILSNVSFGLCVQRSDGSFADRVSSNELDIHYGLNRRCVFGDRITSIGLWEAHGLGQSCERSGTRES